MHGPVKPLRLGEEPPPLVTRAAEPSSRNPAEPVKSRKADWTSNRFAVINAFVDFTLCHLTAAEAAIWLILWRETRPPGVARVAQSVLADRAGVTSRTVRRALRMLEAKGLVEVARRGGLLIGPSSYRIAPLVQQTKEDAGVRLLEDI